MQNLKKRTRLTKPIGICVNFFLMDFMLDDADDACSIREN